MIRALIALVVLHSPLGLATADERALLRPCSRDKAPPPPPGEVVRLFELRKDRNPENVLVIHTYADSACHLIGSMNDKGRLVDMYWRMRAGSVDECYKPTDRRIKSETLKTLKVKSLSADETKLTIDFTLLDLARHDLPSREAEVVLAPSGSGCKAVVNLTLGPKDGGALLSVQEIKAKGKYRLGVPLKAIKSLELEGVDAAGKPVSAAFRGK
jgi:hypothetical protein